MNQRSLQVITVLILGLSSIGAHAQTDLLFTRLQAYFDKSQKQEGLEKLIKRSALKYGVDPLFVRAVVQAESRYNPKARSHKGAQGLMQLMPATARSLGVTDVLDPEQSIEGGTRYLSQLLIKFKGNKKLALAAYNAGITHVRRHKGIPPFRETQKYVVKVMKNYKQFQQVEGHLMAWGE